ncbi:MAG TPA: hypothetical protein DCM87_13265 [Planctomycetes bacterium]|nr:hypothetical protein [Planctomycetota bacterium]
MNLDDAVDIADPVFVLSYLFARGQTPRCPDSADANDDGVADIADPIMILGYLFGGLQPHTPLAICTSDLTPDELPPSTAGPVSCAES